VAGAVTGGGLTIIANAPNPAGVTILRGTFEDEAINPLGLLVAAWPPTSWRCWPSGCSEHQMPLRHLLA
jgi:hypothetical protein